MQAMCTVRMRIRLLRLTSHLARGSQLLETHRMAYLEEEAKRRKVSEADVLLLWHADALLMPRGFKATAVHVKYIKEQTRERPYMLDKDEARSIDLTVRAMAGQSFNSVIFYQPQDVDADQVTALAA